MSWRVGDGWPTYSFIERGQIAKRLTTMVLPNSSGLSRWMLCIDEALAFCNPADEKALFPKDSLVTRSVAES